MTSGTVKFYFPSKGYGFIACADGSEVFVHHSAICGVGYRHLVKGEPVEFNVGTGQDKKPRALDVRPAPNRLQGRIKTFDHKKGFRFIAPEIPGPDLFMHFSDILVDGSRIQTATESELVQYESIQTDRGLAAVRVKRLDPRLPFFRFADTGREADWLLALKNKAEYEDWSFKDGSGNSDGQDSCDFPILWSYIVYTFERLEHEHKITYGSDQRRRYACFNTGLVTEMQEEIFALFVESLKGAASPWTLEGFYSKSERFLMSKFDRLPALANYFDDPTVLLYDRRKDLQMDVPHIVRDNIHRFPESCRKNEYLARQLLESARSITQQRVYRNYKTAIPQFHRGEIQLLLPLCLERPNKADLALVVSRVGDQYRGDTVLTLQMAYSNARLLTRPDTEWLTPTGGNFVQHPMDVQS